MTSNTAESPGYRTSKRQYFAHTFRRSIAIVGPFDTREAAIEAAIAAHPQAKEVTSGYGIDGPAFDIRWTRNPSPARRR